MYLDIAKHLVEIVASTAQGQVVQNVLVHELNVGVAQTNRAIGIPANDDDEREEWRTE